MINKLPILPKRLLTPFLVAVLLWLPGSCWACFSIVVGKGVSAEGCVLVAHDEDDTPPQIVNHHKVPRQSHSPEQYVELRGGGRVEQAEQTWAYLWSEMPGMLFSDSYVNEWGVCVTSDNCPSREDRGELTDGGIGYMLRRLVAERARTRERGSSWQAGSWSGSATSPPAGPTSSPTRKKAGSSAPCKASTGSPAHGRQ